MLEAMIPLAIPVGLGWWLGSLPRCLGMAGKVVAIVWLAMAVPYVAMEAPTLGLRYGWCGTGNIQEFMRIQMVAFVAGTLYPLIRNLLRPSRSA